MLCLARALAVEPDVLLLDEPTSSLDPVTTEMVEELLRQLGEKLTIVIVTHNLAQAASRGAEDGLSLQRHPGRGRRHAADLRGSERARDRQLCERENRMTAG